MATSWTVVMGPSSGTLTLRLRMRLCSFIRILKPLPPVLLSALSPFCPMARAKACSGSNDLPAVAAGCLSLGKSWYFLSGLCILQTNDLSVLEGDEVPLFSWGRREGVSREDMKGISSEEVQV